MIFFRQLVSWRVILISALLCSSVLAACNGRAAEKKSEFIPVSIQGVNYMDEEVGFILVDPANRKNNGGGETINAYSAGGTMCCFALPRKWRPGLKVEVIEMYWVKMPNGTMPERRRKHFVDIPAYGVSEPSELWVIRAPDGAVSIVSSNLQPDHPNWPGAIKGWPVPSIEYQRAMHDRYIHAAQGRVETYAELLEELNSDPDRHVQKMWDTSALWSPNELKPFRGPNDPEYRKMLRQEYIKSLADYRKELEIIVAERP